MTTSFTFPSGFIGAAPTPARSTVLLASDSSGNQGSLVISALLPLMIAADGTTAGFITSSTVAATYAPLASPSLTGTPVSITPSSSDSSTKIATTAFVKNQAYASLASPALTGTPTAPTASPGTSSTQLATTGFVSTALMSTPALYTILQTNATAQWINLGTFTAAQAGDKCRIVIISGTNYSANYTQHQITEIEFTTSNNSNVDGNGFAGSSTWRKSGRNATAPNAVSWTSNAAGVAATNYTLYISMGAYTGISSFYSVNVGTGTWANTNTGSATNPGAGSSTVCVSVEEYSITSPMIVLGGATITGTTSIFSPSLTGVPLSITPSTADSSTKIATTAFVNAQGYVTSAGLSATYAPINNATFTGSHTIPSGSTVSGTGAFVLPIGSTAQEPDSGNVGEVRYNSTTSRYEFGSGGSWINHARLSGDTFTGVVSGQTPATSDSSTKFATTAFVANNGFLVATTAATTYAPINNAAFTGTLSIPSGTIVSGTGAFVLPIGTTGQEPDSGNVGEVRYNSTTSRYEFGIGGSWINHARLSGDTFTGIISGVTVTPSTDSSTKLATTAFVQSAVSLSGGYSPGAVVITGGSVDGTTIGASSTSTGAFTSLNLSSTFTMSGVTASSLAFFNSSKQLSSATLSSGLSWVGSVLTLTNPYNAGAVAITGGAINTTPIGTTTPAAGAFTSLSVNSTIIFSNLTVNSLPIINSSAQLVSATLGSGLTLTGTTLSSTTGTVTNITSSTGAITIASSTTTPAITFVPSAVIVTPTAKSGAYTVAQTDNNASIYTSDTTTVAYTLPTLTAGTVLEVIQGGTAKITWTASGTTVNCPVSGATGTRTQYSAMRFRWVTSTIIIVNGDVS